MSKNGYISLHCSLMDHWLWPKDRPYTELEAWVWLLLKAAHTTQKQRHDKALLAVQSGEIITTAVELGKPWGWDRRVAASFLKTLEEDGMILTEKCTRVCTRLKITNYNAFQGIFAQDCTGKCTDGCTGTCTRKRQVDVQVPTPEPNQEEAKRQPIIRVNKDNKYNTSPKYSDEDFSTAEWIYSKLQEMNPSHKQPNLSEWAETIRLMRERDHRTDSEIRDLFAWVNQDDFWSANILSPSKLRKQWDSLIIKRNKKRIAYGMNSAYSGDKIIV